MLRVVTAHQFLKRMGSGKTKPCLIHCEAVFVPSEDADEDAPNTPAEVELIAKFSEGCEAKTQGLVAEALAAMLAADLDLPVPEPFLVQIEPEFAASIPDAEIRELAQKSAPWAFGSKKLPAQFAAVMASLPLAQSLMPIAAEILAFDVLIANPDRRAKNPNCLSNSRELAIYDHELAFQTEGVIGWRPPWGMGECFCPAGTSGTSFKTSCGARSLILSGSRALWRLSVPPESTNTVKLCPNPGGQKQFPQTE